MDILVISDSHGHADRVDSLLSGVRVRPDAVFFLGDGLRDLAWTSSAATIYKVRGNCDLMADGVPGELTVNLGGIRIFAAHGHGYSVKCGYEAMAEKAVSLGADVMLFGHTHEALSVTIPAGERVGGCYLHKDLHILNPGSIGSSYDPTFGTVTVKNGQIITAFTQL